MKVYIAFSIHGTEQFFVATKEFLSTNMTKVEQADAASFSLKGLPGLFSKTTSRRPNYRESDGVKLTWSELNNKKTKKPYVQLAMVRRKFDLLKAAGWNLVAQPVKAKRVRKSRARQTTTKISLQGASA